MQVMAGRIVQAKPVTNDGEELGLNEALGQ